MKIKNLILFGSAIAILGSGCVSSQKYKDMQQARDHFKAEYENLRTVEQENADLKNQYRVLENQLKQTQEEQRQQKVALEKIREDYNRMVERFNKNTDESSKILSTYSTEKRAFEERLATSEEELIQRERQLAGLEETIGLQSYSMESMKMDLDSRVKRVEELERIVAEKEAQMAQLRASLNDALRGFTASDLTVTESNGKIYVSLSQNLLFKTNSDKVDPKGEDALKQLAKALQANPNIEIIVEGHTDNTGSVDYNWDLSTRRATAVVKILAINGVAPDRLMAAGRGMHQPLVPNDSEANKAKNRRTEIVLSPNLDKLFNLTK